MAKQIRVPARPELDRVALKKYFTGLVENPGSGEGFGGPIARAMDLVVDDSDGRALLDFVQIEDVHVAEEGVEVEYVVTFSAHHGCRDMNYTSTDVRSVVGDREGDEWVFDAYVRPQRQSPSEEL